MNTKAVLVKIVDIFTSLGFYEEMINGRRNFIKGNTYCIANYVETIGFLIEYANSRDEALKNWHEDSDAFSVELGEEEILKGIKKDILSNVPELRITTIPTTPNFVDVPIRTGVAQSAL